MTTDTQPLAPTDAELMDLGHECELDAIAFGRAVLAKWGQPAHSGEPVAWRYVPSKVWGEFVYTEDPKRAQHARDNGIDVQPVFTTPQPTQPQAGAVPLTDEQRKDLLAASFCIAAVGDPTATIKPDDAERIINLLHEIGDINLWPESLMRAFADATCAIRASHGQAPAQPVVPAFTEAQIASACLSYRHDFGLLGETDRKSMMWIARQWERAFAKEREFAAPGVGNSGFDNQTAADFLNGKTVSDEAVRKFVQASRWAHDEKASLSAILLSVRGELASREAEIALLKKALMEAEAAPQPSPAAQGDALDAALDAFEHKERGIPQARIAAALVAELRAAIEAASTTPTAQGYALEAAKHCLEMSDPLQGAANWLVTAHSALETSTLAGKLSIGYNRAKRLHDAALAAQGGTKA